MPACSSCWSFVSFDEGFKFQLCAKNVVSNCSKTRQDASKDHYHAFPWEKRRCCVEAGNVSVVLDITPSPNDSFILFFWWYKIYFSSCPALSLKWQVINVITAVHPTKLSGNASKKIEYLPLSLLLSLCNHMGLYRLQDYKDRRGLEITRS
jgi:hypothetical protein